MKPLIAVVAVLLLLVLGWYLIAGNDPETSPTPSISRTPTPSASPSLSPSPSPSVSGSPTVSGSRTPTPAPTGTPFTSANVRVTTPRPNQVINSPLVIEGEARGNWYFEASFPVELLDGNGKRIATGFAQAQGDWMTTNFVPFKSTITFTRPATNTGRLVLHKDNPSGLPQNAASVSFIVRFR